MKTLLLSILLVLATQLPAQEAQRIDWKLLSKVEFEDRYSAEYEAWYLHPVFSEEVKALDGQRVVIKGYVIPLDVEKGKYALSAYPFSSCFFCGGAGPESVIGLKFPEKPERYDTDDYQHFEGILELNDSNQDDFNYLLNNARAVDP